MRLCIRAAFAGMVLLASCQASVDPPAVRQGGGERTRPTRAEEPVVLYGWNAEVAEERLRWRACTAEMACAFQDRETGTNNVLAVDRVGEAIVSSPDGLRQVDVQKITLRHGTPVTP